MKNIYGYTPANDASRGYVEYLNLSRGDDGKVVLTVRPAGTRLGESTSILLPDAVLKDLASAILAEQRQA